MYKSEDFASVLNQAIPVRLAARSFIIPVPAGIGSLCVYPCDVYDKGELKYKKGEPMLNKQGVQKHGIAFVNYTDNGPQQANDDGTEMVIINGISEEQGRKLLAYYQKTMPAPENVTEAAIHEMMRYAHEELGINDFFDGDARKIPDFDKINVHPKNPQCGTFIRRSSQERFAIVGVGSGTFDGPIPQRFEGNVVVVTNGKRTWMVQTPEFLDTYRHPDGSKIKLNELAAFAIADGKPPTQVARLTR